jgi:predicted ATPase
VVSLIDAPSEPREVIRTPDQRLRVFVSSTLDELASERAAVRAAIERLRLTPVMFELGARPHPPRALYRAYLEQSDVFIGLYWQSYGWVAPEMAMSGIEDEYELASRLPCLVYVKEPAPRREQRLEEFLQRMQAEDRVSFKRFHTAEQLADLVADDLALLLTEHFDAGAQIRGAEMVSALRPRPMPVAPTRLVGRERELEAIRALIEREDVRLLTLSGMGGIGKTRLALAAAAELGGCFADGLGFADLAAVQSPELVPSVVAAAIGVRQEGTRPAAELLVERLTAAEMLLVLDNFEHVIAAAPFVSQLLAGCPKVKVIVTSRALLRLRGEHEFPVIPLEVPPIAGSAAASVGLDAAAVRLFVERAQEHQASFTVQEANAEAVVKLCQRLEGIPLAIELAAARVRVLPPGALLDRIGDRLDLLSGSSDLPERQRTLRATMDWSYNLLEEEERVLFAELSVFVGGFTLDGAQAVCGGEGTPDVVEGVSSLVEKSLIVPQGRPDVEPRFRMLQTVREYAQDRLERSGKAQETGLRMAQYFAALAEQAAVGLSTSEHRVWLSRLDAELDNMRAAISFADEHGEPELFLRLSVLPWVYWWPRGYFPEMRPLLERCLESYPSLDPASRALQLWGVGFARNVSGDTEAMIPLLQELMELQRARGDEHGLALAQWGYCSSRIEPIAELRAILTEAAATLRQLGDQAVTPFALATLGMLALVDGDRLEAERLGQEAVEQARAIDSEALIGVALLELGYSALALGDAGLARARFAESAEAFQSIQDREGLTYALDGLAAVALAQGRPELAARAVGAADATRERLGLGVYPITQRAFRGPLLSAVEAALGTAAFEAARTGGTETDVDQAVEQLLSLTVRTGTAQPI